MSIHPSLSSKSGSKKQRFVLSRAERIKILMDKGIWKEGQSIFALPKIKTVRIKIKKEKAEKATQAVSPPAQTAAPAASEPTKSSPAKK